MTQKSNTLKEEIIQQLRTIYDPEIPVNIVELGLVYEVKVEKGDVTIEMTLTNPACPVAAQFPEVVQNQLSRVPEVKSVTVHLVWEPPWTPERMSEAARLELGIL